MKRLDLLRQPNTESMQALCGLSRDLLHKNGTYSQERRSLSYEWDSALGRFGLLGTHFDSEFPQYRLNAQDEGKINVSDIYTYSLKSPHVHLKDQPDQSASPSQLDALVTSYVLSNDANMGLPETNQLGAQLFKSIMAHLAIDTAVRDTQEVDLSYLAGRSTAPTFTVDLAIACESVTEAAILGDDLDGEYCFSYAKNAIIKALKQQIARQPFPGQQPALPPAPESEH